MTELVKLKRKSNETALRLSGIKKSYQNGLSEGQVDLRRNLGNEGMQRLLRVHSIQTKLTISQPDDVYEQEADRVADQVMRMPEHTASAKSDCPCSNGSNNGNEEIIQSKPLYITPLVQRKDDEEEEEKVQAKSEAAGDSVLIWRQEEEEKEEEPLQAKRDSGESQVVGESTESRIDALQGGGTPLHPSVRAFMEPRFGVNFSDVHVHTDGDASETARAVHAQAFTVGRDVVFSAGQYDPESESGKKLLAHELAHVVQQNGSEPQPIQVARQIPTAGAAASLPAVSISRQGGTGNTFLSTETISFTAQVTGIPAEGATPSKPTWTVQGLSTNSGNGNPHTIANQSNFSFVPNPTNRLTTGSRTPNNSIRYQVNAQVGNATTKYILEQDETDIIRQEYTDFGATPPSRADIIAPAIATFNTGNYSLIVDKGMNNALTATQTHFQALSQQAAVPIPHPATGTTQPPATGTVQTPIVGTAQPPAAGTDQPPVIPVPAISVESGYRNPRRNVAAGSQFPVTSKHVQGSALDLSVAGANAILWARLRKAGEDAGNTSICEHGPTQLPCDNPTINHVHIQW
jgi:hypothetical protein